MNTLNYCNNIQNCNYRFVLLYNCVSLWFVWVFQLKKMRVQNLEWGIFGGVYENAFHFWRYNENGCAGEKNHQTALCSLAVIKVLPMKLQ